MANKAELIEKVASATDLTKKDATAAEIGRASCRERVFRWV